MTALLASLALATGLLASATGVTAAAPASSPAPASAPAVVQSSSPAATPANRVSATPATSPVDFSVGLALSDAAGAQALERAVSDPASSSYRHYVSPAQWEKRFSPT